MSAERSCPKCGQPIPADSPYELCPACLFEAALEGPDPSKDETLPMARSPLAGPHATPSDTPSQSTSTLRHRPKRPGPLRWLLIPPFAILAIYIGLRLLYAQEHPRPSFWINQDMTTMWENAEYGITPEHKLVAVNNTPVATPTRARTQMDATPKGEPIFLRFEAPDNTTIPAVNTAYLRLPSPTSIRPTNGGEVRVIRGSVPEYFSQKLSRLQAVNDKALEEFPADAELLPPLTRTTFVINEGGFPNIRLVADRAAFPMLWARFFAAVAIVAIGLAVYWLKPGTRSAIGFISFTAAFGTLNLIRSIPLNYRIPLESYSLLSAQCLLVVSSAAFMLTFTPFRLIVKRISRPLEATAAFSALLFAVAFFQSPERFAKGLLGQPVLLAWAATLFSLILFTTSIDKILESRGIALGTTDKQRSKIVRVSVLLAFGPGTLLLLVRPYFFSGSLQVLAELAVFVFPLLLGYAIVRHNLLRLNELVREGVMYSLLLASLLASYAVATGFLAPMADRLAPGLGRFGVPAAVASMVMVAIPLHTRTRRYMDSRFRRIPLEYEKFAEVLEQQSDAEANPSDFAASVTEKLQRATAALRVTFLLRNYMSDAWEITAACPNSPNDIVDGDVLALLNALERDPVILLRDDVLEGISPADDTAQLLEGFYNLEATMLVPLVARRRVIGAIALGDKLNGQNYLAVELKTLRRIARHASHTLSSLIDRQRALQGMRIVDIYPDFPDTIGPYHVDGVVGQGGMAYVFHGFAPDGTEVALKVAKHSVQSSEKQMERFHREARAMQRLDHPNLVTILDVGWHAGEPYIALEYLAAGSVDQQIRLLGGLEEGQAILYLSQAIAGLEYALQKKIIHRDIKPRNLFVTHDGVLKVGDFGIARIADETTITSEGEIFGTPDYMAPELVHGSQADWNSDQYALGITLFEMLSGRRPFVADNLDSLIYQYLNHEIPDIRAYCPNVSEGTAISISKMTNRDVTRRYKEYSHIVEALGAIVCDRT